jgi:hypothetical protein
MDPTDSTKSTNTTPPITPIATQGVLSAVIGDCSMVLTYIPNCAGFESSDTSLTGWLAVTTTD